MSMLKTLSQLTRPFFQKNLQLFLSSTTSVQPSHRSSIKHSSNRQSLSSTCIPSAMDLKEVVKTLESIAPINIAEDWDNVGLLVEPSNPCLINCVMLTNDLTESVMREVLKMKEKGDSVGLIISYHPPIFRPLKRLTQSSAKERIIIKAIESGVAVYSPHTTHDALWGGVNDWVLSGLGGGVVTPLSVKQVSDRRGLCLKVGGMTSRDECEKVLEVLKPKDSLIAKGTTADHQEAFSVSCKVDNQTLTRIVPAVTDVLEGYSVSISPAEKVPVPGAGRLLKFSDSVTIQTLISRVKSHLGLHHVRMALPDSLTEKSEVTSLAVCVGSGASVLKGVQAQVFLTGEMSHHDILDATSRGTACILCEHSNTERGFLKVFKAILEEKLDSNVRILISQTDKDPISVV